MKTDFTVPALPLSSFGVDPRRGGGGRKAHSQSGNWPNSGTNYEVETRPPARILPLSGGWAVP